MKSSLELDGLAARRQTMVAVQLQGRGIADSRVLGAMGRVPRHEFVAPEYQPDAYGDQMPLSAILVPTTINGGMRFSPVRKSIVPPTSLIWLSPSIR